MTFLSGSPSLRNARLMVAVETLALWVSSKSSQCSAQLALRPRRPLRQQEDGQVDRLPDASYRDLRRKRAPPRNQSGNDPGASPRRRANREGSQGPARKGLLPRERSVDSAYVDGELLIRSFDDHGGVALVGPMRPNNKWQVRIGGYEISRFKVGWERKKVIRPEGVESRCWSPVRDGWGSPAILVEFPREACRECGSRHTSVPAPRAARGRSPYAPGENTKRYSPLGSSRAPTSERPSTKSEPA